MEHTPLSNWCAKSPDSAAKEIARLRRFIAQNCEVRQDMPPQDAKVVEAAKIWSMLPEAVLDPTV